MIRPDRAPANYLRDALSRLTDLADAANVANFHVVVREWHDDIVFAQVVPGRST